MSFLFPAFLLGALAVAVPVVLHLLRRDVAPEVPFTAVRLLRRSPAERSRKRRLRDLILLAARVAALALLAAAFARPYLRDAVAQADGLRIVAVDRSFSMDAPGRFEAARRLARAAVDEAPGAGQVAVMAFDDRAVVLSPPGTAADAHAALSALRAGFGATQYAPVVAKAAEIARDRKARLVIVTDLQRAGWAGQERARLPGTLEVAVLDVGAPPPNLAVGGVRVDADRVVAAITNGGPSSRQSRVTVAHGNSSAVASFTAPGGSTVDVPVSFRVPAAGVLRVSVDDRGGFAADDTRYALLDPPGTSRVLVITSALDPASGFYVSRALAAAADPSRPDSTPAVRALDGPAVAGLVQADADAVSAVVLLSTRGLDRRGRDVLAGVVRRGGGLLVAGAPDVEPALVAAMFGWQPALRVVEQEEVVTLSATDPRHPVFRTFGGLAANLGHVRFTRSWRVPPEGWDVPARFTNGTPALLERAEGRGRVVVFASDLDRRGNDFPLHPAFVPFMSETLRHLAGDLETSREFAVASAPAGAEPRPGVYELAPEGRTVVVNVDARESGTARLTAEEFDAMLDRNAAVAALDPMIEARQAEASQGLWRYGLLLMIAVLVAESLVGKA